MNKKTSISKLLVVLLFLAAYCNVLVTQLTCNFSHLAEATEQHDHHGNDVAKHSHGTSHKHNDSKDDHCCNDNTAGFFAAQTNPVNTSFEFKNTFFAAFISFSNPIANAPLLFSSKGYLSYQSPPPKIPDIRVFTHSFLI